MTTYIIRSSDGDYIETNDTYEAEQFCNYKESYGHETNIEVVKDDK